jgi:iron complex outermembrane receptor protein
LLVGAAALTFVAGAWAADTNKPSNELSLEDLVNIKVTSVSKKETRLEDSPAAIAVLTQDDIQRLGATSIAEALRAVPGVEVARMNANTWAVTARGFNNQYADRLLVLVDGRSVYTPTFGGVYWDLQDMVLEDLDRIEVIRGPGGSLWGANAFNGVINIITKSAKETQGGLISTTLGTEFLPSVSARYGGELTTNLYYRVYGKYFNRDGFEDKEGRDMDDNWHLGRGGARLDWEASERNTFTLSGDYYRGEFGEQVQKTGLPFTNAFFGVDAPTSGGNVLGRWTHTFSEESELKLQAYYDAIRRTDPFGGGDLVVDRNFFRGNGLIEKRDTWDLDLQHRFPFGTRQSVMWGLGFRYSQDSLMSNGDAISFNPEKFRDRLFSAFVQDEIRIFPDKVSLTLGSKFEHNDFTGFEAEPSGRLLWTLTERQTVWGAIGRAVRTPTRVESHSRINLAVFPLPDTTPAEVSLFGNPDLDSETVLAYEAGYRFEPTRRLSFDVAGFYNDYHLIASRQGPSRFEVNPTPHLLFSPYQYQNGFTADSYGAELLAQWHVMDWWHLRGSYSWLHINGASATGGQASPQHQFNITSSLELGHGVEFDAAGYYTDEYTTTVGISAPATIRPYLRLDLGMNWRVNNHFEVGVWGQNLVESQHKEFGSFLTSRIAEVPRTFTAKLTFRF